MAASTDPTSAHPLHGVPTGRRVVVRYLIEDGERATDALGELVDRDATSVTVRTRRERVRVPLADVVLAKQVPPAGGRGWRVAGFLRRAGVAVLDLDGVLRSPEDCAGHGTPVDATVRLVEQLVADGIPLFVFTDGTDRVPEELASIGLGHLAERLLNSADLGHVKPAPEAYAAAHAEIERRLGRTMGRAEVHFTDDRVRNVEAARVFGWQARVFTLP